MSFVRENFEKTICICNSSGILNKCDKENLPSLVDNEIFSTWI